MVSEARIVVTLEVGMEAVVTGKGQRGTSEKLVMLFISVHLATQKFSVCKNFINLQMSVWMGLCRI